MVRTQVCQFEVSWFKSRSGQIAYFHGVKTRLSTSGTGDVPRGNGAPPSLRPTLVNAPVNTAVNVVVNPSVRLMSSLIPPSKPSLMRPCVYV